MMEITKEEIREKMFFINDEGLDPPIAVIKVADLMDLDKANMAKMEVSKMEDKIKQAVADEFKYRASQGRTNYSMEEVIYIVSEVIDEVFVSDIVEKIDNDPTVDAISNDESNEMYHEGYLQGYKRCKIEVKHRLNSLIEFLGGTSSELNDQKIEGKEPKF